MNRTIVDVRESEEYATGHVAGAIKIPPGQLMAGATQLANLPGDTELVPCCRSGSRSNVAKNILTQQGFTNIVNGINKEHVEKMTQVNHKK